MSRYLSNRISIQKKNHSHYFFRFFLFLMQITRLFCPTNILLRNLQLNVLQSLPQRLFKRFVKSLTEHILCIRYDILACLYCFYISTIHAIRFGKLLHFIRLKKIIQCMSSLPCDCFFLIKTPIF